MRVSIAAYMFCFILGVGGGGVYVCKYSVIYVLFYIGCVLGVCV